MKQIQKLSHPFSPERRKKLLQLLYSFTATGIFNVVIQLILYPDLEHRMGEHAYGVALSVISLIAIIAGSCGSAVGNCRLLGVTKGWTEGGDYHRILLGMGVLGSSIGMAYLFYLGVATPISLVLFVLLNLITMLRFYSEVEFRISTDFFRYMIYYILISAGYIVGLFLFRLSHEWMLALIVGEALALLYVALFGTIYRPPLFRRSKVFLPVLSATGFLFLSVLIDNVTLHADRILLLTITKDGSTVTLYYIASLAGKIVALLTAPLNALVLSYLVRYEGKLSRTLWSTAAIATLIFGAAAFGACMLISPPLIRFLYPSTLPQVAPILVPAILGQIFYFASGLLMTILLRFKGEKRQLLFNAIYAVIFFVCVVIGTVLRGLRGFALAILLANGIRFFAALLWGFWGGKGSSEIDSQSEKVSSASAD